MMCEFNFVVRQIMHQSSNSLPKRRHFCFDANPYPTGRRGLRRNRNVWRTASSDLSHWQLESTPPNTALEPTPLPLEFMDGLSYKTIIEPAEPLAGRRDSALGR
jgi:hypothetical protein